MIRLTILATVVAGAMWVAPGSDIEYAQPIPIVPVDTVYRPAPTTTTTEPRAVVTTGSVEWVTTTTVAWPDGLCNEWFVTAHAVGWPRDLLPIIGEIMWHESRCDPSVTGNGAYGLTQLQWSAHSHWITDLGFTRGELHEPATNLALAWHLYQKADTDPNYRCGLSPWYMSTPARLAHWCDLIGE
jgi:hypothetical protein